jgi:hypothetical protein
MALIVLYIGSYGPWHYLRVYFGTCSRATHISHWPFIPIDSGIRYLPKSVRDSYHEYCLWWVRQGIVRWGSDLDR